MHDLHMFVAWNLYDLHICTCFAWWDLYDLDHKHNISISSAKKDLDDLDHDLSEVWKVGSKFKIGCWESRRASSYNLGHEYVRFCEGECGACRVLEGTNSR